VAVVVAVDVAVVVGVVDASLPATTLELDKVLVELMLTDTGCGTVAAMLCATVTLLLVLPWRINIVTDAKPPVCRRCRREADGIHTAVATLISRRMPKSPVSSSAVIAASLIRCMMRSLLSSHSAYGNSVVIKATSVTPGGES
jgi:hypothetical protein